MGLKSGAAPRSSGQPVQLPCVCELVLCLYRPCELVACVSELVLCLRAPIVCFITAEIITFRCDLFPYGLRAGLFPCHAELRLRLWFSEVIARYSVSK